MKSWLPLNLYFIVILVSVGRFAEIEPIDAVMERSYLSLGFLLHRTVSVTQKSCSCSTTSSCSCCQSVTILLRGVAKNLCVNFAYQQTGLSMNITLGSNTIRHVSVIDYRAFKVCTSIPDCRYSFACVDVMEVSLFPRSITICAQLDVMSKAENWVINYNCISLSTILPNQSSNASVGTMGPPNTTNTVLNGSTGMQPGGGQMPPSQTGTNPSNSGQMPPPNGSPPQMGQMPEGQMPPGQMPGGQMPPGQMPGGQMPPGQMQRMANGRGPMLLSRWMREVKEPGDSTRMNIRRYSAGKSRKGVKIPNGLHRPMLLFDNLWRRSTRSLKKPGNAAAKMQVILRGRNNGLPRMRTRKSGGHFGATGIVNGETISIPMSEPGSGNSMKFDVTPSNNVISAQESMIPVLPPGVFVLQNTPFIQQDEPIESDFSGHYDNRTSSFPNRIPPGFGIVSRIGPEENNQGWIVDRSVEELETPGPRSYLDANSKIVELPVNDNSDGKIIFPE
ncbi:uncharacterized protein LOC124308996 isoform X3 [Neodiprion virginianus]|uniref:uncharacterized protein LOC124308996 isoform X3 n=1 Tax=Neodiprion virginianus TaxID=2961670 RepID=UPI001EE7427E|nr:uncharacterized protein LOC124308996 isoform X3 [Neodiprion virginianus]